MWYRFGMSMVDRIKALSDVIIDGYFVVEADRSIVHFNQAFYSMLPRTLSRGLTGKKCYDVLDLDICRDRCIAKQCWEAGRAVRLDEISGTVARGERRLTFILSALPFFAEDGSVEGALVIQRNVTDEAQVQSKYQEMLENEKRERERLKYIIRTRTKDLMETSRRLLAVQKELLDFRRGRIV